MVVGGNCDGYLRLLYLSKLGLLLCIFIDVSFCGNGNWFTGLRTETVSYASIAWPARSYYSSLPCGAEETTQILPLPTGLALSQHACPTDNQYIFMYVNT